MTLFPSGPQKEAGASAELEGRILQFVLDSVSDGITVVDACGNLIVCNQAAARLSGVDPSQHSWAAWWNAAEFFAADGTTPCPVDESPLARALRGEVIDPTELALRPAAAPDGKWLSVTARPCTDSQGIPIGAIAVFRDITERKQVEMAWRAAERRYRVLFEKNLAGILRTRLDGRVLECNEAFARMLGYDSSHEAAQLNAQAFYFQASDRDQLLERLRQHKCLMQEEVCFRQKNGDPAWILTNLNLVESEDEPDAPTLIGTILDITAWKQSREALRETQQQFAAFMRHMPGVAFMKDREGRYVFYNGGAEGLFPHEPAQFLGRRDDELWPAQYADDFAETDREVLRTKKLLEVVETVPHKHGVHQWLVYKFPILDENEEVQFIGGVGIDITERRQLEDQLRQSQKMEAIGRLAGGVAHDFNNLLTVISGYGHMILRGLKPDDPLHSCIEEILNAASRATSLTNQLLAFSRRQVIQPKVLDLNALVANMDRMLRRVIGEHIELETVLTPGLGSIKADAGQLEQVILNLAVNARDAMPEGGKLSIRTANVDVRRSSHLHADVRPGSYVRLTVADTGEGMDAEIMVHLFEPFYTSKDTGKGTGLGLSTVYGIVKQGGGDIVVESQPGRGATFNIYLPRVTGPTQAPTTPETGAEFRAGTETILLVEDETGVRQLVREMLHRLGYTILEASSGADAIRIYDGYEGTIDLLLTDVIMPQMSGRDLAERLKGQHPHLKVLYISGYTDDMLAHHGVLESNVFLLPKPFAPDDLAKMLRKVLDTPQTRRADA